MFRTNSSFPRILRLLILTFALCFGLGACKSVEERAEAHFTSAQELIDEGDLDRAVIELRNVFELVPNHVAARETMAALVLQKDDKEAAYGHYLRLVEQVPDHVEGRTVLAEIAFSARNWEEFSRHATEVIALAPDAPRTQMIELALQYEQALAARDVLTRNAVRDQAAELAQGAPNNDILQLILFDAYVRNGAVDQALMQLEKMIAKQPDNRELYAQKLALLEQQGDFAALETQLRDMVIRFADEDEPKTQLIQFLLARGEPDKVEAFLREVSDPAAEDPTLFFDLVRFINHRQGPDAARAELRAALEIAADPKQIQIILAALDFENGAEDTATETLQTLLESAEEGSDSANRIRIALARMRVQTGNEISARQLVAEILEADSDNVEALKMQAAWMIQDDEADEAIATLRLALDTAPDDVAAMDLISQAYTRAGNHELSRDFLALAVDASENAPEPSLRYAQILAGDERYIAAEEVLIPALQRAPGNADMLVLLGEIYLAAEDYARADGVIARLRRIGTERTLAVADALQARLLGSREGVEQALGFLRELSEREDASLNTQIALLRARLSSGQTEAALKQAEALVAEYPENTALRFILATSHAANGALDVAEAQTQALVEEDPRRGQAWVQLYRLQRLQGKVEAASQTLRNGRAALPFNRELLWAQAGEMEAVGDIDGAIANYELLYDRNSNDLVAANNLSSLLSNHKTDASSLERAWAVARRLNGTDVPAFQDTYGWLVFRRGQAEEALPYLESAAAELSQDPIVQFHLGQTYAALRRQEDAVAQYRLVLELAEDGDPRPQIAIARTEISRLETLSPAEE